MNRSMTLLGAAVGFVILNHASAADDPPATTQQRIDAIQKELDALKEEQAKAKLGSQDAPKVTFNSNRFVVTSADGRSSIGFRALVQGDAAFYNQDREGPLGTDFRRGSVGGLPNRENNAARDLSSGMYFRRARFGVEGAINRDFNYRLILELGGSGTETQGRINDAWINYTGFAPFTLQIGAYAPPVNLEDGTSADDTLFIERATPTEIARAFGAADGRLAFTVRGNGARWMSALSLTGRTITDAEVFDAQRALVGRFAFLALTSGDYNLHVGANGTYILKPADAGFDAATNARFVLRLRDRPELRVDSARLIDTGNIDADHGHLVGAEVAGNWKNFHAQAEHFWYGIDRIGSVGDPRFTGYYAYGSWVITGESHRYNMANGGYAAPRPLLPFSSSGGIGALELALRYSHMDLNYKEGLPGTAPMAASVRGGEQNIWTLGFNWYPTSNIRLDLNVQRVDVDRLNPAGPGNAAPFGASPATPPIGAQIGQQYSAYALRSQFNF